MTGIKIALAQICPVPGDAGANAEKIKAYMKEAADGGAELVADKTGIETVLWDERLTSEEAAELLRLNGIGKTNEKDYIDMVAAKVILESYLSNRMEDVN